MKLKGLLVVAILFGSLFFTSAAYAHGGMVHVQINGVDVASSATHIVEGTTYVDVAAYTRLIGVEYTLNAEEKTITVNGKTIAVHVIQETPTAPVRELAVATGGEKVSWDQEKTLVYVLDLPDGNIQITPSIPTMGEHWANPASLPTGPIYGVQDGKLVFVEYMFNQSDFTEGKSWNDLAGMRGLPSTAIEHNDIQFEKEGHEGMETPHYDIHGYLVTHEEHMNFGMPAGEE